MASYGAHDVIYPSEQYSNLSPPRFIYPQDGEYASSFQRQQKIFCLVWDLIPACLEGSLEAITKATQLLKNNGVLLKYFPTEFQVLVNTENSIDQPEPTES